MLWFTFCFLLLIVIGATHLHNWLLRRVWGVATNDNEAAGIAIMTIIVTALYVSLVLNCIKYIVVWCAPLYNK